MMQKIDWFLQIFKAFMWQRTLDLFAKKVKQIPITQRKKAISTENNEEEEKEVASV